MKKTLSERLAENLEYFVSNPKRRCKDSVNGCRYYGGTLRIKTKGCFVRALMPVAVRKEADKSEWGIGVSTLIKDIKGVPRIITENPHVMCEFQMLHDEDSYWNETGLSVFGKSHLKQIIYDFDELNEEDFKKFLS